jgi:peptidoglycan/LPS O-acetylase OafA/YrhL
VAALRGEGGQEGAAYSLFTLAELARPFLAGALAALLADRIALRARYALGAALAMIALTALGLFDAAFPLFGAYLVLYAGFVRAPLLKRLSPRGDYSYGLYVWGFPMQQMTQALLPAAWFVNFVIAFPLALAAAALSWRFIESPALRLKPGGAAEPKRFVTISQARQGSLRPQSAPLQSSQ